MPKQSSGRFASTDVVHVDLGQHVTWYWDGYAAARP
jgi:hypothetical protein